MNRALNVIDQVEFTRAGQWLQQYCRERGYPAVSRVSDDEAGTQRMCWAVIMDDAGPCKLRFCLGADGRWQVLCYVDCAGWERFPLIPSGAGWCDIADALEAAPLHVHWGWI